MKSTVVKTKNNKRPKINWSLFLLIVSSNLYLSKLGFSPVYVLIPFLALLAFARGVPIRFFDVPSFIFILMCLMFLARSSEINGTLINFLCFSLTYLAVYAEALRTSTPILNRTIKSGMIVVAFIIALDSIYRIYNPSAPNEEMAIAIADQDLTYYLYKYNTIMFNDSNTTGLLLLCWCGLILFLMSNGQSKYRSLFMIFSALLIMSLSRSAIAGLLFMLFMRLFKKGKLNAVLILLVSTLFILITLSSEIFSTGSGLTKIEIVQLVLRQIDFMSISELLFGYGVGQSEAVLGIYGHNLFVNYFIDLGLLGILGLLLAMVFYNRNYKETWPYTGAIVFASLSYFFYQGAPFFAAPLAIMAVFHGRLTEVATVSRLEVKR